MAAVVRRRRGSKPQSAVVRSRAVAVAMPVASVVVVISVLGHSFGAHHVIAAVHGADLRLVGAAFVLGLTIQVLKARRAVIMLGQAGPITWLQSFSAMVIGNGLSDLIPLAPAAPAFRAVLTNRVARTPIAFAIGVFVVESALDGIGVMLLTVYLLVSDHLGTWLRVLLIGTAAQAVLFLLAPVLVPPLRRFAGSRFRGSRVVSGRLGAVGRGLDGLASGLMTVVGRGWRTAVPIVGISLAMTALAVVRLDLLLRAFGLGHSMRQLILLMALSGLVDRIPINLPGSGTWAETRMLHVAGVAGLGASGYVLLSRTLASTETPILALIVVAGWALRNGITVPRLRDIRATVLRAAEEFDRRPDSSAARYSLRDRRLAPVPEASDLLVINSDAATEHRATVGTRR